MLVVDTPGELDFHGDFPHLAAAPIVEAVIHWQARGQRTWDQNELSQNLAELLPDYPEQKEQYQVLFEVDANLEEDAEPTATRHGGWRGLRLLTPDKLNIAQFNRDGFVFSRLRPYQNWEDFEGEARRLWKLFLQLAAPSEIGRLGIRFINRIALGAGKDVEDYLNDPPNRPLGLPIDGFLYQSTLNVPNHPLGVNIVKTVQRSDAAGAESGLILDIDVFTKRPLSCSESSMNDVLPRMRWLKNAVFFSLIKSNAIETFKESK
jgi:uncharacterized protein (TIGR04255 family)